MTQRPDGTRLQARERFLGGDGLDPSVRPEISASWRRSVLSGVPADHLPDISVGELDDENRLLRAAAPVLDRMTDDIVDSSMSLVLTDGEARILDRRVGMRRLRAELDRVYAVPGAAYTEEAVGTNGIGTCIETRRPFIVAGGEHFAAPLCQLTCAAAPIIHPFTGRLEGVLDVTAAADQTSGLMVAFVREAAAEIRRRLQELASLTERSLFDAFLAASRRSSRPVLSVNGELVIANAAAARLLEAEDHAGLWDQIAATLDRVGPRRDVTLVSGATLRADVEPIGVGSRQVGALVRLDAGRSRRRRPTGDVLPGLVGGSAAWRTLCRDVTPVAMARLDALLSGEDGTGRLAVARSIHLLDPTGPFVVLDGAASADDPAWSKRLRAAITGPGTVVLRHIDQLSADRIALLATLCEGSAARLLATAAPGWAARAPRRLVDRFPAHLTVPSLRDRLDDLPVLGRELVRRHGAGPSRIRPDVIAILARQPWPGNVRELENVLRHALARHRRGDLRVDDLPVEYRAPVRPGPLTAMQGVERDAIVKALDGARGNKQEAAGLLGISRSTLYRKLATYGL